MQHAPEPADEASLDDLRRRLRSARLVPGVPGGWQRGTDQGYLAELVEYWADRYDWRAAEARMLALPWVRTGAGMRAVHQRAADPAAPTVVLLHGWPDSFLRFERVLPLLTDVHVVVPCLPGYPFSPGAGSSGAGMAEPVGAMLTELGVDRFVVSGGDIGSSVALALARREPARVAAIHLTDVPVPRGSLDDPSRLSAAEQQHARSITAWQAAEGAYAAQQGTKPNTLSAALGDSPVGLAAWIVEKLRSWSDCDGDVEHAFPRDDLLTWITLYWLTGSIGTSFAPYALREPPAPGRVAAPAIVSLFPHDLLHPPREFAQRTLDVRIWDEQPSGGHFAAWERPDAFAAAVRSAIGLAD